VPVLVQSVAQIPRAVADVELGVVEIADAKPSSARVDCDSLRGVGQQLHEPDRAGIGFHAGTELALLVDHRSEQRGVEAVVAGMAANDRLVLEGVPEPHPPAGLGHVHVGEAGGGEAEYGGEGSNASQGATRATRARMVSATKSSSCCRVPSFT